MRYNGYLRRETVPDALEVHWADLHHMSRLLALENTITSTASHTRDVQQLCAIDHVIV